MVGAESRLRSDGGGRRLNHVFAGATLLLGLVLLLVGGALLVRGASEIAAGYGVSPMVVGLTVVAFGTSTPELVINAIGASSGATELAFGNVVGSNISNLALVLGAAAIMAPIKIQGQLVRREVPLLLLATTIAAVMALDSPLEQRTALIGRSDSVVLLLFFCIFLYINVLDFVEARRADPLMAELGDYPLLASHQADTFRWLLAIGGCVLLFAGGKLTVDSGVELASSFGVSATLIGLFVVAIGTSLPELVTSIIAATRGESDLALGNVVGSNLFNTLVVLPVSGTIHPIEIPDGGLIDLTMSWVLVALLIPVFYLGKARLGRLVGSMLIIAYVGYAAIRMMQSPG